jgi:hypothetical protein
MVEYKILRRLFLFNMKFPERLLKCYRFFTPLPPLSKNSGIRETMRGFNDIYLILIKISIGDFL